MKSQHFSTCSSDLLNKEHHTSGVPLAMSSFSMWKLCPSGNRNLTTASGIFTIQGMLDNCTCTYTDQNIPVQHHVLQCQVRGVLATLYSTHRHSSVSLGTNLFFLLCVQYSSKVIAVYLTNSLSIK